MEKAWKYAAGDKSHGVGLGMRLGELSKLGFVWMHLELLVGLLQSLQLLLVLLLLQLTLLCLSLLHCITLVLQLHHLGGGGGKGGRLLLDTPRPTWVD